MATQTKKLRVGIAGYGIVGRRRRIYIDQHPFFETVAIADEKDYSDEAKAEGLIWVPHYKQLLEQNIDVLFVCVPNFLAPEAVIAGLEKGCHVFCEKPPGRFPSEVEEIISVEKRHPHSVLKYGFNHRYHESVKDALALVQSGELGKIVNARGTYGKSKVNTFVGNWRSERNQAGGGILLDQGIHMVDLLRLFCGEFPEVKSFVSNDFWNFDVEDNAFALMRSKEGKIAMLHSSATQWRHRFSLELTLTEGFLRLEGILSGTKSYGQETLTVGRRSKVPGSNEYSDHGSMCEETRTYLQDPSWKEEVFEFADVIRKGGRAENGNSHDALETMKLVYRIYYSDPVWRERYHIPNPD